MIHTLPRRSTLQHLWRTYLNPSRSGAGGETSSGRVAHLLLFLSASLGALVTIGIVFILLFETIEFFREISFLEYFGSTQWSPLITSDQSFGVWALVSGTVMVAVIALIVGVPLGLLAAIFLSEFAPEKVREVVKPVLEILAGVPTVVYGYFALLFITPIIRDIFNIPGVSIFNALSAGIVMGIMVLPMISSLSEDAMSAVPRSLREASFAMGATRMETAVRVVLPAALSGVIASIILAFSRAIGETMIVTIAAGQNPNFTIDPRETIQTMTSFIVQISLGDTPQGSLEFRTLFAVAMTLFVFTLGMNLIAQWVAHRFREEYE